jgi:hypothetical protein
MPGIDINIEDTRFTHALPTAPVAVHIKELNQIAPLLVDSLRVDHVRHIDPLRIERLDITHLPSVNIALSQLPTLDLNVRRVPPVAISLQQQLDMNSHYTMRARLFGLEVMSMEIQGKTKITPRDCARREQSRSHERSFPDVAAAGNPAIPSRAIETSVEAINRQPLNAGARRFDYSLHRPSVAAATDSRAADSAVRFGG